MLEAMGMKAGNIGHLAYCSRAGLGQYDLAKIDIHGEKLEAMRKPYRLPADIDSTLEWTTPILWLGRWRTFREYFRGISIVIRGRARCVTEC
jgi:hypothetical protein